MNITIAKSIAAKISQHHSIYPKIPIKDIYWESILSDALHENNHPNDWICGSHSVEADIFSEEFGNISCKSGKLNSHRTRLTVSGSRTTKHKSLKEKIAYLSQKKSDYMYCLVHTDNHYNMILFNSDIFRYDRQWEELPSGWKTTDDIEPKIKIVKSMSDQVWYDIDLNLAEKIYGLPII